MSTNHEYDNDWISLCELRHTLRAEIDRLAHFFQMTVASSLLGSERADDCQILEIEQSFCYNFFGVPHSATTTSSRHIIAPKNDMIPQSRECNRREPEVPVGTSCPQSTVPYHRPNCDALLNRTELRLWPLHRFDRLVGADKMCP